MIGIVFKIRIVNVQKVIEVPGSRIKGLDNISLTGMVKRRGKKLISLLMSIHKKVQVGKDQEKVQSEKDSHSKNQGGKKPN